MELQLGKGEIEIVTVRRGGRIGVLLRQHDEPHPVGEFTNSGGQEWIPNDRDVVIWIDSLESGRIFQDTVNLAVLNLQGIPREKF